MSLRLFYDLVIEVCVLALSSPPFILVVTESRDRPAIPESLILLAKALKKS
ncbi:MAG: hypothetical protein U1C55_11520 [Smithellaceae bacterium]|nr:hypothetical protein [Smithellaceae bacterium]